MAVLIMLIVNGTVDFFIYLMQHVLFSQKLRSHGFLIRKMPLPSVDWRMRESLKSSSGHQELC